MFKLYKASGTPTQKAGDILSNCRRTNVLIYTHNYAANCTQTMVMYSFKYVQIYAKYRWAPFALLNINIILAATKTNIYTSTEYLCP